MTFIVYLEEDIGGEHKGEADTGKERQVGKTALWPRHHELLAKNKNVTKTS